MAKLSRVWSSRMRLVLALSIALAIAILLDNLPAFQAVFLPLQQVTAMLAFVAIKTTGLPIAIDDVLLTHPHGFRVAISYGCTPLIPAIFVGSILTLGLSLTSRARLVGLSSSIVLLTLLNLFRVAALYYIGVVSPQAFALAHEWLGPSIIVLGTALLACYWISASIRAQPGAPAP